MIGKKGKASLVLIGFLIFLVLCEYKGVFFLAPMAHWPVHSQLKWALTILGIGMFLRRRTLSVVAASAVVIGCFIAYSYLEQTPPSENSKWAFDALSVISFVSFYIMLGYFVSIPIVHIQLSSVLEPTIGVVTALPHEYEAVQCLMLGCKNRTIPGLWAAGRRYCFGHIPALDGGAHEVVLAMTSATGNNSAAARAVQIYEHFQSVNAIMMVGIAGAVPNPQKADEHVRLGDIVVSNEKGIIQYDFIKDEDRCEDHKDGRGMVKEHFIEFRFSPRPPDPVLLEACRLLRAGELGGNRPWDPYIAQVVALMKSPRPAEGTDVLASSGDPALKVPHPFPDPERIPGLPKVHYGPIASANVLLKNATRRDQLRDQFRVKAVEMENSGIADATWTYQRGYLAVRGTCDYCDSSKGDAWQRYAAVIAAAYTRALIESLPTNLAGNDGPSS